MEPTVPLELPARKRSERMNFFRLYSRVLALLKPEARLAWILAIANILLAAAQFAEPVLFGRIIDALVKTQAANARA